MLKFWNAGIGAGLLLTALATPCQGQTPAEPFDHLATAKESRLDVAYVGHSMKYSIAITNECDWPQSIWGYIETGGEHTYLFPLQLQPYERRIVAVTVSPKPVKAGAKSPFPIGNIALVHYETTAGPKTCLASEAKERLLADAVVPVPAKTMTDLPRSVTAAPFTLTQTVKATEPEKKIGTTPNQPAPPTTPNATTPVPAPAPPPKPVDRGRFIPPPPPQKTFGSDPAPGGASPKPVSEPPSPEEFIERLRREVFGGPFKGSDWEPDPFDDYFDGNEQDEMLRGEEFDAEPTEVMEPEPLSALARAGAALLSWLRRPSHVVAASMVATARPADPRWAQVRALDGSVVRAQDVSVAFVATGEASGQAFTVRVLNRSGRRVHIALPDGLILAPAKRSLPAPAVNARGASSRAGIGYCVNFAKLPPPRGAVYRVAPKAVQERYQSFASILRAGRALARTSPAIAEQPDPEGYDHSIQQWALWTRIGGWDRSRFTTEFVERTRKNISEAKGRWTKQVEQVVRDSAVTRWTDVQEVLKAGALIESLRKTGAGGAGR